MAFCFAGFEPASGCLPILSTILSADPFLWRVVAEIGVIFGKVGKVGIGGYWDIAEVTIVSLRGCNEAEFRGLRVKSAEIAVFR